MNDRKSPQGNCFTLDHKGISKVVITSVEIESAKNTQDTIEIKALWDTGAEISLIRSEVVSRLNLQSVSRTFFSTPSDPEVASNVYSVNLYLPNHARVNDVQVAEGVLNDCDMLIGMDIITLGDFAISNFNGKTTFTFRMPSLMEFDFCKHSYLEPCSMD